MSQEIEALLQEIMPKPSDKIVKERFTASDEPKCSGECNGECITVGA